MKWCINISLKMKLHVFSSGYIWGNNKPRLTSISWASLMSVSKMWDVALTENRKLAGYNTAGCSPDSRHSDPVTQQQEWSATERWQERKTRPPICTATPAHWTATPTALTHCRWRECLWGHSETPKCTFPSPQHTLLHIWGESIYTAVS